MNIFNKASFGLIALAALTQAGAAQANGVIDVAPTVTAPAAGSNAPYQYSYDVTPGMNSHPEVSLGFTFSDPNVSYVSNTGPLDTVAMTGPGSFRAVSSTAATLDPGNTETLVFTSLDGPASGALTVTGANFSFPDSSSPVLGPGTAPVPEASTTVSFGLLLMLGLGGVVLAARKKKQTA